MSGALIVAVVLGLIIITFAVMIAVIGGTVETKRKDKNTLTIVRTENNNITVKETVHAVSSKKSKETKKEGNIAPETPYSVVYSDDYISRKHHSGGSHHHHHSDSDSHSHHHDSGSHSSGSHNCDSHSSYDGGGSHH